VRCTINTQPQNVSIYLLSGLENPVGYENSNGLA
jgi:hypothetical protein